MNKERLNDLIRRVPQLKNLDLSSIDTFAEEISRSNLLLWPVMKELIFFKLYEFFERDGFKISSEESVYLPEYLDYYSQSIDKKLSLELDLTFPFRTLSKISLIIIISSTLLWLVVLAVFFNSRPEYLLFGYKIIIPNFLLLLAIPFLFLRLFFPRLIAREKFKGVETFEDLIEDMYGLNLWRYRSDNFYRLKDELKEYLNAKL